MNAGFKSLLILLMLYGPASQAADGLAVPDSAWQRWQARLAVGSYDASTRVVAASLLGDYYFRGLRLGSVGTTGGFRATSGLVAGAGSALLGAAGVPARLGTGVSLGHLSLTSHLPGTDSTDSAPTLAYLGLGYTSIGAAAGWGFTADVGVVAQNTAGTVALGRALFGTQSLDAALRSLRLMPVLQLGVRYTF